MFICHLALLVSLECDAYLIFSAICLSPKSYLSPQTNKNHTSKFKLLIFFKNRPEKIFKEPNRDEIADVYLPLNRYTDSSFTVLDTTMTAFDEEDVFLETCIDATDQRDIVLQVSVCNWVSTNLQRGAGVSFVHLQFNAPLLHCVHVGFVSANGGGWAKAWSSLSLMIDVFKSIR